MRLRGQNRNPRIAVLLYVRVTLPALKTNSLRAFLLCNLGQSRLREDREEYPYYFMVKIKWRCSPKLDLSIALANYGAKLCWGFYFFMFLSYEFLLYDRSPFMSEAQERGELEMTFRMLVQNG